MNFKNWTKEEFKAYLLIYAAESNFNQHEEQIDFIDSKFDSEVIYRINKEIKKLNDFDKISIVTDYIKLHNFSQNELDSLLLEIKEVYHSDGKFDSIEKSIFSMLKKLLTN
tara:strand:- start:27 stop:359 length:333 start_codon:yes stop_codon:yes gene_type:complete